MRGGGEGRGKLMKEARYFKVIIHQLYFYQICIEKESFLNSNASAGECRL